MKKILIGFLVLSSFSAFASCKTSVLKAANGLAEANGFKAEELESHTFRNSGSSTLIYSNSDESGESTLAIAVTTEGDSSSCRVLKAEVLGFAG